MTNLKVGGAVNAHSASYVWGKYILTASLVLTVVLSIAVDLNATHLFNPKWHPHAVFHDAAMLNLLAGTGLIALWLLWRRSSEPHVGVLVAWLVPLIFWSAFFWASTVFSGASLIAIDNEPMPYVGGVAIPPNVIVAFVLILLSTVGFWLCKRGEAGHDAI